MGDNESMWRMVLWSYGLYVFFLDALTYLLLIINWILDGGGLFLYIFLSMATTDDQNRPNNKQNLRTKKIYQRPKMYISCLFTETRRYGPLRGPTSSFGLWPLAEGSFCPSGKKRPYYPVLANFRPSLVSSSNLSNF